ncbi:MAG: DUF1592 domain-containing protein [Planctomycetota bacterium]
MAESKMYVLRIQTFQLVTWLCLVAAFPFIGAHAGQPAAVMPLEFRQLFKQYCYDCHDSETKEGTVDLETIPFEVSRSIEIAERWAKVLDVINSGEMPPEDCEPIADEEKLSFLKKLSEEMVIARSILSDSGGVITLRRLNRREYANTIEALIGIRPDVSNLPDDQATGGFDTHGNSLFFSSDQLEQYLAAADDALRLALRTRVDVSPRIERIEPENYYNEHYAAALAEMEDSLRRAQAFAAQTEKPASEFGFLDDYQAKRSLNQGWIPLLTNYANRPENQTGATLIMTIKQGGYTRVKLPRLRGPKAVGKYIVRLRAAAFPEAEKRLHYVEFASGDGQSQKRLGWRKVTATLEAPEVIEFSIEHLPGQDQQIQIHQRSHQDRADKALAMSDREKNGLGTVPGLWIDWVELVGPLPDDRERDTRSNILVKRLDGWSDDRYAGEVLRRFATKAFRGKQPSEQYLHRLVQHFNGGLAKGMTTDEALILPLSIVLASPSFLYMQESEPEGQSEQLSDRELAVRLSYFLWSEPPDEALMELAEADHLSNADDLKEQTERLLSDSRADRFVRSFVYQWLDMQRLGMFQFNGAQFRTFDNAVRDSAAEEIFQTVRLMLDERIPLRTLLRSDFVVINDILADYYGLPGFVGHEFRRVELPRDSKRGGLIGTAAVLAMGSDGVRASAVERGAWVLRHLLHDPPPPAPPNVPMLTRFDGEQLSARELARAHQEQPQCAQCHQKIDPVGFGLENFDASGTWREQEVVGSGRFRFGRWTKETRFEIDPSGQLPGGVEFANFHELRDRIAVHEDAFARGLVESLIAYGLGRPYGFTDKPLADAILAEGKMKDYELSTLILALVRSETFRSR